MNQRRLRACHRHSLVPWSAGLVPEEPVVEQPAAGGADPPGQDLQNQDGEALGDGKVMYFLWGINCYIVDCRERWLPQAVGAPGAWEG